MTTTRAIVIGLGLLLLGYPLHPAGKPEKLRVEHLPRLTMPVMRFDVRATYSSSTPA